MKILVLDNYDSFTYNLVQLIRELGYGKDLDVIRNDKVTLEEVEAYDYILLSPGPGVPAEAGIMPELIRKYAPTKCILGICLGHQGIAEAFGAQLYNLPDVLHGVATPIKVVSDGETLFRDVPKEFKGSRYHSWAVVPDSVTPELEVTSVDASGQVMGLRHRKYAVKGLQFHPESVLTEHGKTMIKNWLTKNNRPKGGWIS
jgi:anthranilate synthase component 2